MSLFCQALVVRFLLLSLLPYYCSGVYNDHTLPTGENYDPVEADPRGNLTCAGTIPDWLFEVRLMDDLRIRSHAAVADIDFLFRPLFQLAPRRQISTYIVPYKNYVPNVNTADLRAEPQRTDLRASCRQALGRRGLLSINISSPVLILFFKTHGFCTFASYTADQNNLRRLSGWSLCIGPEA